MIDFLIIVCMILALAGLIWAIVAGKFSGGRGSGIASLTAFHDFQPKDKQRAVEMIIEQKAGTKQEEQKTSDTAAGGGPASEGKERP
ncbi:MAG: hypothetical protein AB1428_05345 [Bacteroidota bacterium]